VSLYPHSSASILGLMSAILSVVCLVEFAFLYRVSEGAARVGSRSTNLAILVAFGIVGVAGIGIGIGSFVAFLGLGIIETRRKDREFPVVGLGQCCGPSGTAHLICTCWCVCVCRSGSASVLLPGLCVGVCQLQVGPHRVPVYSQNLTQNLRRRLSTSSR